MAFRVTRAQGFTEGNKRTALLLARWTLDNNGLDGSRIIDPEARELADLLVQAAAGRNVDQTSPRDPASHSLCKRAGQATSTSESFSRWTFCVTHTSLQAERCSAAGYAR